MRAIRSLHVPGRMQRHPRIKQRERGFDEARYVESLLVLNSVGGDCLEDFDQLREDPGSWRCSGTRCSTSRAVGSGYLLMGCGLARVGSSSRWTSRTWWIWSSTGPMGRAYVSPLFLPDAGPCLACLLTHFRRLSPAADLYDDLTAHAAAGKPVQAVPFPGPAVEILRQLISWKASLVAEPQAATLYRLHVVEVGDRGLTRAMRTRFAGPFVLNPHTAPRPTGPD